MVNVFVGVHAKDDLFAGRAPFLDLFDEVANKLFSRFGRFGTQLL